MNQTYQSRHCVFDYENKITWVFISDKIHISSRNSIVSINLLSNILNEKKMCSPFLSQKIHLMHQTAVRSYQHLDCVKEIPRKHCDYVPLHVETAFLTFQFLLQVFWILSIHTQYKHTDMIISLFHWIKLIEFLTVGLDNWPMWYELFPMM